MDIKTLFSAAPLKVPEPVLPIEAENEAAPYKDPALTVLQNRERELRTIYVGNVPVEADKKEIYRLFKAEGQIDKIWVRSVPTTSDGAKPQKAKVALKDYTTCCKAKNCYVLFKDGAAVESAVMRLNNSLFRERHLHVTPASRQERDFKSTLFIGNLPYEADEEVLRAVFTPFGRVEYVRVVRDPTDHRCKGFAYVKMHEKAAIEPLLRQKLKYGERELRISKARKHPQTLKQPHKAAPLTSVAEPLGELKSAAQSERNPIESKVRHESRVPSSIIGRKIKKLKKRKNLTGREFADAAHKLQTTEMGKLSKQYLEKDNLLKERRELRKKKKEMNKAAAKRAIRQS